MIKRQMTILTLVLSVAGTAIGADGWGDLKGQFIWKGAVPEPELLHLKGAAVKDATVCAGDDVWKEDIVIDKETRGIANIFIYLPKAPKKIRSDLKNFEPRVVFDQQNCVFKQHALLVRAGQTVEVLNSDPVSHNTHTFPIRNQGQNLAIPPNTPLGNGAEFPTKAREILPIQVKCDFHPWMLAYWLILDHPYADFTDTEGRFQITGLPAGKHKFRVWHERVGYLDRNLTVEITDGETTDLKSTAYRIEKRD